MFYRVAVKWLIILVIVLVGFLMALLFLGYLLKENEAATTQLKTQLDQEAYQRHEKEHRKIFSTASPVTLSAAEKSQQKVITDNLYCESDQQCFLVHTHSQALGCIVAVNTQGTVILLKIAAENERQSASNRCQHEYQKAHELSVQCKKNLCAL